MELGRGLEKELREESVWAPNTPVKSTPPRLKSEDVLSAVNGSPSIIKDHGQNWSDERAKSTMKYRLASVVTPSERVRTQTKTRGNRKRKYRPKVEVERNMKKSSNIKNPKPSTPKPHTPKPPNCVISQKRVGRKNNISRTITLEASPEACQDVVVDPNPSSFPNSSTEVVTPPNEESVSKQLVFQETYYSLRSCRRSLGFDLLLQSKGTVNTQDCDDHCTRGQSGCNSGPLIVYHRKKFNANQCINNIRKSELNFPMEYKKRRVKRMKTRFSRFLTSLLAGQRLSETEKSRLEFAIAAKNNKMGILKKRRRRRRRKVNISFSLCPVKRTEVEQSSKTPSGSVEITKTSLALIPVEQCSAVDDPLPIEVGLVPVLSTQAQSGAVNGSNSRCVEFFLPKSTRAQSRTVSEPKAMNGDMDPSLPIQAQSKGVEDHKLFNPDLVPLLPTRKVRRIDESTPRLYIGILIPCLAPPPKKPPAGLGDVIKQLKRLNVDDTGKQRELVLFAGQKKKRPPPNVNIDQETEREWNLLMENFYGRSGEEERDAYRDKWWEKERKLFCDRARFFIACMHLIQGDRRFSEWKGSVVDSVVGVFLTQNVSDHLSSSAYMTLASRFPIRSTNTSKEREGVSYATMNVPITSLELEPERTERYDVLQVETPPQTTKKEDDKKNGDPIDWDELRRTYGDCKRDAIGTKMDSVDWEAVRLASVADVANAIKIRGQQRILGGRIQDFLNRLVEDHGSIDLEWLRDVPPDKAKDYLLSFKGLGLKSVECLRLLTLHHHAFPVDTNVARVAVRLGWVPLQPLPGDIHLHLLDRYPVEDKVQVYLWPRLCSLDHWTLYELHYQMITFGKVFCKKRKPSCGACPLRRECRHYASQSASDRHSLPWPKEASTSNAIVSISPVEVPPMFDGIAKQKSLPEQISSESRCQSKAVDPIIEYPPSPLPEENLIGDIEDCCGQSRTDNVDEDYIPTIKLNNKEWVERVKEFMSKNNSDLPEEFVSDALITVAPEAASLPPPKLKDVYRLRTVHQVYELPDSHPILERVEKREPDDPSPYLLAIWTSDVNGCHSKWHRSETNFQGSESCHVDLPSSCDHFEEQCSTTVGGTLLIPCRTATRGSFPLNGTYFQVNEVFIDDESAGHPIIVPRRWLWNLERRNLYCGSSVAEIFRGLSTMEIRDCFWKGFVCVRAFNRRTRAPVDMPKNFHVSTAEQGKRKWNDVDQELSKLDKEDG